VTAVKPWITPSSMSRSTRRFTAGRRQADAVADRAEAGAGIALQPRNDLSVDVIETQRTLAVLRRPLA
jgi:hypothetical protein